MIGYYIYKDFYASELEVAIGFSLSIFFVPYSCSRVICPSNAKQNTDIPAKGSTSDEAPWTERMERQCGMLWNLFIVPVPCPPCRVPLARGGCPRGMYLGITMSMIQQYQPDGEDTCHKSNQRQEFVLNRFLVLSYSWPTFHSCNINVQSTTQRKDASCRIR